MQEVRHKVEEGRETSSNEKKDSKKKSERHTELGRTRTAAPEYAEKWVCARKRDILMPISKVDRGEGIYI